MEAKTKKTLKKVGKITADILICIVVVLALIGVVLTVSAKRSADNTATLFGLQMRIVLTSSMEESPYTDVSEYDIQDIPVRSMVFVETVPDDPAEADAWYKELKVGDVLTFRYLYNVMPETITHRITKIDPDPANGGYVIELKGDNKNADSENLTQVIHTAKTNTPNRVLGKVVGQSYLLGLFVCALQEPVGLICMIILPATVIAIWEIIRIINLLNAEKKKRAKEKLEALESKAAEVDDLMRRLAELEAAQAAQKAAQTDEKSE